MTTPRKPTWSLRVLDNPADMQAVEELQRQVWPGSETEIIPAHMLLAVAHSGGLLMGALTELQEHSGSSTKGDSGELLVGFVYGYPGIYYTPDGPRLKHCSHMLGIHPNYRNLGLGFALKRAQWQMVRHQGIDRITWTYDPLLSLNARLNISKLGAVCNTYLPNFYGELRDNLNVGLTTDRFQVDWWVNSHRVYRRLSRQARRPLSLPQILEAGAIIVNPAQLDKDGFSVPIQWSQRTFSGFPVLLVEIPADFLSLKSSHPTLAQEWRSHSRVVFEELFHQGYMVTDFVYTPGVHSRSFYVLSHGESTL